MQALIEHPNHVACRAVFAHGIRLAARLPSTRKHVQPRTTPVAGAAPVRAKIV
ncbi:hypothetical protein XOC_4330 [Xanthomonas oryzae pv. oryzicola BLS256]|uniref:Uncharacterized protein n=1 Tax=Xanthomonas oryzae pv. oryzicola (strain BLS256) TaxID=383407 RepID=G7TM46_XANOB|nr:hypothetical protein XOC_4330 [Xanthomonas oryzae pv. oryzicola BLS256]